MNMHRRAFSLIEVLMAVFILALGLLGIGAVIPVVIREQRSAQDASMGLSAMRDAQSFIRRQGAANRPVPRDYDGDGNDDWETSGFSAWFERAINDEDWGGTYAGNDNYGERWIEWADISSAFANVGSINLANGLITFLDGDGDQGFIPVIERITPEAFTPGTKPLFVWDFLPRWEQFSAATPLSQGEIELAVFVRRIDPGINAFDGIQLANWLIDGDRVAVGEDEEVPTFSGQGTYSPPFTLEIEFDDAQGADRSIIEEFSGGSEERIGQARQIGQKLVDNRGNIYTVIEVLSETSVRIEPAIPGGITNGPDFGEIDQVALTAHIPVSVEIVRVKR